MARHIHKKTNHYHHRNNNNNVTNLDEYKQQSFKKFNNKKIEIIPRNLSQEAYTELLLNPNKTIIFATGPAGTGKTMLAVLAALKNLRAGNINKILLSRPAVGVDDEKHGFLPGDLNQKMEPWTKPLFDIIYEYYSHDEVKGMLEDEIIEICPLAFMRGRTFKDSWIILDEAQNCTPNQMKMALTRIGENSRMVITGDVKQTDKIDVDNGLLDFRELYANFSNSKYVSMVQFKYTDIERHPAVAEILKIYKEEQ